MILNFNVHFQTTSSPLRGLSNAHELHAQLHALGCFALPRFEEFCSRYAEEENKWFAGRMVRPRGAFQRVLVLLEGVLDSASGASGRSR